MLTLNVEKLWTFMPVPDCMFEDSAENQTEYQDTRIKLLAVEMDKRFNSMVRSVKCEINWGKMWCFMSTHTFTAQTAAIAFLSCTIFHNMGAKSSSQSSSDVCQLRSRQTMLAKFIHVSEREFFQPNCSKFVIEYDWNTEISQNVQNLFFFVEK